ncbi:MAG TPA: cyclic nucleotide-binding domain-containing protein [Thermodesulfovibrionales bacterium]|nr:cyclic nucleotide-binding domain-containing protein [Thermodesulfovibrionales bacterium]
MERIHIFQGLDGREMGLVKALLESREYDPNEMIYKEGDRGDSLNIIEKGKVKIHKTMIQGDQFCIATLRQGDIFGIMSFLDSSDHDATIIADQRTKLVILRKSAFDTLSRTHPSIGCKILLRLATHLASIVRNMNSQYIDLTHLTFRKGK